MSQSESLSLPVEAAEVPVATEVPEAADMAYWRQHILITTIVGYALFYFVRKNLSLAMPELETSLGITKAQLGGFLTAHGLLYGVSKFVNGIWGDRANARWFMCAGLLLCALMNVFFGMSTTVVALGLFWMLNGWFQGMGFPPCARLMTHWFSPSELATKMSVWNSSHSLGAGIVVVLCGYLAPIDWRLCFFVPAGIAVIGVIGLSMALRDTPESMGFPPVAGTESSVTSKSESLFRSLGKRVFSNPYIWILSFANFFVYIVRYGILDWGPTFLKQARGIELSSAGWMVAGFEIAGIVGMLSSGWITDRFFGGRGGRTCLFYMAGCLIALLVFWNAAIESQLVSAVVLSIAGFFIYGPQCLIGICAANLATKQSAAAAVGLTGLFGYASTFVSGYYLGSLVDNYGWNAGFMLLQVCTASGLVLFVACWPAKAHGYQ